MSITYYGSYLSLWRLPREVVLSKHVSEKTTISFDEDSTTMAVATSIDCLGNQYRHEIDGVSLASTSACCKENMATINRL